MVTRQSQGGAAFGVAEKGEEIRIAWAKWSESSWVTVGIDHDTAQFAGSSITRGVKGNGKQGLPKRHATDERCRQRRQQ
jgi:hypothetical protein